ncbi:MAG TPA: DUF4350 domain-containing protein, partial [Terriglobales bacterium]|nr:DUF4350 domain-containing protein [Terriglobales bacterium]
HWAVQFQKHTQKYDDRGLLKSYYSGLRKLAQSVDVVSPYAPLTQYKLVVAPSLNVVPKDLADHLLEYVRNGGHLVLGPRSAMKDETNALLPQRQPGYLLDALGARVEQYYALEKDFPVSGAWGNGQAMIWAEQLKASASDAQVLLRYGKSNGWLDDQAAAISRPYGKGRITYIGAVLDETLTAAAIDWMIQQSGVKPVFGTVPDGVEVSCRRGENNKGVFVVINFAAETKKITLPRTMKLLLQGKQADSLELPQYGVEVLTEVK